MSKAILKLSVVSHLFIASSLIGFGVSAAEGDESRKTAVKNPGISKEVPANDPVLAPSETLESAPVSEPTEASAPEAAAEDEVREEATPVKAGAAVEAPASGQPAAAAAEPAVKAERPTADPGPQGGAPVTIIKASEKELKQQVSYVKMMMMGKSAKRIAASGNADAIAILDEIKAKIGSAEEKLNAGDTDAAQKLLADAMKLFNTASNLVPSEDVIAQEKERYAKLQKDLETALSVYKRNYDRTLKSGAGKGVVYDKDKVNQLVAEADKLAEQNKFADGGKLLVTARDLIDAATSQMMHKQELVYQLKLDTPQDEYKYEHDQYLGYEELVPVAIENNQPSKGQMMLIKRHVEKAGQMAADAEKKAQAGEYPVAIRMVKDATEEVRKALKIMGVPLY